MTTYSIQVQTGDRNNAGTNARVYIQLIGANDRTRELRLDNASNNFERGKLERFQVTASDVGWINAIRLFHDNGGDEPGWYPEWVRVRHEELGIEFKANIYRWLAKTTGDKRIDITVPIPVANVSLGSGRVASYFIGYNPLRRTNNSTATATFKDTFAFQHRQGLTLKRSSSLSISTGA